MGVLLYNISIGVYKIIVQFAALFNTKAKLWIDGRKGIFDRLQAELSDNNKIIWVHCASLGEFEQGRPVMEKLKSTYPEHKILLTFFSPSGYEIRKNYAGTDWVFYLPIDTKRNAKKFIRIVSPVLTVFVKYEYWYHYLNELNKANKRSILISAIFRQNDIFFKWYGSLHRKMLNFFSHLFVQTEDSFKRIQQFISTQKITLAGDTRFDRVLEIANGFEPIKPIEEFTQNREVLVAGSTWPADESHLKNVLEKLNNNLLLIIAPHEINKEHIDFLKKQFSSSVLFSELKANRIDNDAYNVLIIDNIGMLSKIYYYGSMAYIGGGFNKSGIHNTLEAAVYSKPVIFGPNYEKFSEAIELIKKEGGFTYKSDNDLFNIVEKIHQNLLVYGHNAGEFVKDNSGATSIILSWIRQNAFLSIAQTIL